MRADTSMRDARYEKIGGQMRDSDKRVAKSKRRFVPRAPHLGLSVIPELRNEVSGYLKQHAG